MPQNKFYDNFLRVIGKLSRYKTTAMTLAVVVVFITTYLLILPAFTLEKDEAERQGGIDIPVTETTEDTTSDVIADTDTAEDTGVDEITDIDTAEDTGADEITDTDTAEGPAEDTGVPLDFEGNDYSVTVVDEKGVLPEGTSVSVEEIDNKERAEDYVAYCNEALAVLQSEEGGDKIKDIAFARFYDITLTSDGNEIEPAAGDKVNVKIEFDKSAGKELSVEDNENVRIIHFTEDKATGELIAEVLDTNDNNVKVDTDNRNHLQSAEFDAYSFSVYAVVCTVSNISTQVITADGYSYTISVTYDDNAEIPEGAKLEVKEITPEDLHYNEYVERALAAADGRDYASYDDSVDADYVPEQPIEGGSVYQAHEFSLDSDAGSVYTRLFDIVISFDGKKIEPKADVSVQITLKNVPEAVQSDLNVVHFGSDGDELVSLDSDPEVTNNTTEISFLTNSFSVYAISSRGDGADQNIFNNRQYVLVHNNVALSPEQNPSNTNHLRGVAVNISGDTISTDESELPVWTVERIWDNSANAWRYYLSTVFNGSKVYLNMVNQSGGRASVSPNPQAMIMDYQNNDHYEIRFRVAESPNAALDLDYNNIDNGFHAYVNGQNVYFRLYELGDEIINKVTIHFVDRKGNPIEGVNYTGEGTSSNHITRNQDGTFSINYDWKGDQGDMRLDTDFSKTGYSYASSHLAGQRPNEDELTYEGLTIDAGLHSTGSSLLFYSDRGINDAPSVTNPDGTGNRGYFPPLPYNFNDELRVWNASSVEGAYSPANSNKDVYVILDPITSGSGSGGGSGDGSGSGSGGGSDGDHDVEDPNFSKKLEKNPDGTYTLSLSVTGHAKNVTEQPKANILLVVDTSSSMNGSTQGGSNRLRDTKEELKTLGNQLLGKNVAGDTTPNVELAMISFDGDVVNELDWVSDYTEFASCVDSSDHLKMHRGTDWEDSLKEALVIADRKKAEEQDQPVFIVFFTDGEPSQYTNFHGIADFNGTGGNYYHYYSYFLSREAAKDEMRAIVQAGHRLYGVYAFNGYNPGTGQHPLHPYNEETGSDLLHHAIQYGYGTTANLDGSYFHYASNKEALNKAFTDILRSIYASVGFEDIVMTDSITSLTSVGATLDEGSAHGFRYTRSGGNYGSGENWTDAPPVTFTPASGNELASITWDLSSCNILEDGVTYTVSLTVWPSQEAYDYVTKLNNGFITIDDIPESARSCFLKNESTGKYEVVTNPVSGPDGHGNVTNEIDYKKVQSETVSELPEGASTDPDNPVIETSQEGEWPQVKTETWYEPNDDGTWTKHVIKEVITAFGPPDKNMELDDSAFKVQKVWRVSREEEMVYYLYDVTTGLPVESHKYLEFDVQQVDDPEDPEDFSKVVMGYDDNLGDFKWADTTHTVVVHDIPHQIGKVWENDLDISYGLMISPDYAEMRGLYLGDKRYIPIYASETARQANQVSYYILEKGHDYKIDEPALDYRFEFQTEIYHPMLVNGTPSNVKINYIGSGDNEYGIIQESESESVLKGENVLRGELKMSKVVIGPDGEVEPDSNAVFDFVVTLENEGEPGPFYDDPDDPDQHNIPWYGVRDHSTGEYLYYHKIEPNADGSFEYVNELTACIDGNYNNGLLPGYDGNRMIPDQDSPRNKVTADIRIRATDDWNITNIPSGSIYTIEEVLTNGSKGYEFVDAVEVGSDPEIKVVNPEDPIISGNIEMNTAKEVIFRNQRMFEFDIIKVDVNNLDDEDPELLSGAKFRLDRYTDDTFRNKDSNWGTGGSKTSAETLEDPGKFHFDGLKEGYYKLVETEFPIGYVKLDTDPVFKVVFDSDSGEFQLLLLSYDEESETYVPAEGNRNDHVKIDTVQRIIDDSSEDIDDEDGEGDTEPLTENIILLTYGNEPGAVLPNSGGIGTTIFYILGSMLLLGCGVYLIARRRVVR